MEACCTRQLRDRRAMPKAARAASQQVSGGVWARRSAAATTPTGRPRSAPRWTAAAAIIVQEQLVCEADSTDGKTLVLAALLQDGVGREAFVQRCAAGQPSRHADLARDILGAYAGKVQHDVQQGKQQAAAAYDRAVIFLQQLTSHSGPPGRMREASADEVPLAVGAPVSDDAWLDGDEGRETVRRPAPGAQDRPRRLMAAWGLDRLGRLPGHAVICVERAEGRVHEWRKRTGASATALPPVSLVRALVHV